MKRFALIAIGLVAALAAVVVIVPSFFNWNSQKGLIEERASDALGQPVSIDGDLSLSILPTPRLSAEGLTVGARDALADGPFISADLIDIRVAFMPLLSGKIEASRIILGRPDIALLTGQNSDAEDAGAATETPDIALPEVLVEDGQITLVDAATGAQTSISNINLTVAAQSMNGPFSIEGDLAFQDKPVALSIQAGRINTPDFPFEAQLSAQGAGDVRASLVGTATDILGQSPQADAQLSLSAANLGEAIQTLSGTDMPSLNGEALRVRAPITLSGQRVSATEIDIALASLNARANAAIDMGQSQTTADITLSAGNVDMALFTADTPDSSAILEPIEASLPEGVAVTLKADVDSISGLPVPIQRAALTGRLAGGKADIALTQSLLPGGVTLTGSVSLKETAGQLTGPVKVKLAGANASALLTQLMGPGAALPPAPLPLDLQLDGALERGDVRLRALVGKVGQTTVNASGSLDYGPAPDVALTARLGSVNLDDWLNGNAQSSTPAQDGKPAAFDGTVKADITIAALSRAGETYEDVRLVGRVAGDTATLETLSLGSAVSAKGTVSGLSSAAQSLDLSFKASGQNANQLLALAGQPPVEMLSNAGRLSLSGTVRGTSKAPQVNVSGSLGEAVIKASAALSQLDVASPTMKGTASLAHKNLGSLLTGLGMIEAGQRNSSSRPFSLETSFDSAGNGMSASLSAGTSDGRLDASYEAGPERMSITAKANAADLTAFVRSLGIAFDPAGARLGGLNANIALSGPENALLARTFDISMGPAKLTGSGQFDVSGPVTKVDLRLTGENLDLAALMPEAETGAQQAAAGTGARWSKEPMEFKGLKAVDGVISVDLNRLTWRTYELKNARASLSSEGPTMRFSLDRGTLFDGPASMAITLDGTSTPTLSLDVAIQSGDVAKATQSSAAIAPLTGTFDLNGSFNGRGASEYEIVKALSGQASFSAREGVINGVDIVSVNERFGNLSTVADFVSIAGRALQGGQTAYELIALDAVAKNGMLTTQNMQTKIDGGAQAALDSNINLPDWTIQATGSFALEDHPQAPPVGVRMAGPLDNPRIDYQTKDIQNYLGVRLGAAVLKGVVGGEGFGFKDLIGGGRQQEGEAGEQPADPQEPTQQNVQDTQEQQQTPEEQLRDLILEGLFGGRKKRSP